MVMFSLFGFNKDKEYKSCEWLEYGMACLFDGIHNCCIYPEPNKNYKPVSEFENNSFNFKKFFKIKNQMIKMHKKGQITERCVYCPNLKSGKWISKKKLKYIVLGFDTKCNADCIYCYTHHNKIAFNARPCVSIIKFIKECIKKQIIDKDTSVNLGGGEPTLNEEFDEIVTLLSSVEGLKIRMYSSGIKYSPAVENCLKQDNIEVIISPDSGDRELYKKIKNVDKFDVVWENLGKYAAAQNLDKYKVKAKYILIEGVNDNEDDIKKFFDKVLEAKINFIKAEIDINYANKITYNEQKIKRVFELLKLMEQYADNLGLKRGVGGNMSCFRERYDDIYNSFS